MNLNKISIITPTLNSEYTIEKCILSVINQKLTIPIEYIIVDGGSTDNTLRIIDKYRSNINKVIIGQDKGLYSAFNIGIKNSNGDLISILGSDDYYEKGALQQVVEIYNIKKFDVIHGNIRIHRADDTSKLLRQTGGLLRMLILGMSYQHQTFFVTKEIYKNFIYDESYRILADYKFTLELLKNNTNFCYLDKVITNVNHGGISNSRSMLFKIIKEGIRARKELGVNKFIILFSTLLRFLYLILINLRRSLRRFKL